MKLIYFDTETEGLIPKFTPTSPPSRPRIMELAWAVDDGEVRGGLVHPGHTPFQPHPAAFAVHGITNDRCLSEGRQLTDLLTEFIADLSLDLRTPVLVAHNIAFDLSAISLELHRLMNPGLESRGPEYRGRQGANYLLGEMAFQDIEKARHLCTMSLSRNYCFARGLKNKAGNSKAANLEQLHRICFPTQSNRLREMLHGAVADVCIMRRCLKKLCEDDIIKLS